MEADAADLWDAIVAGYRRAGPLQIDELPDDEALRDTTQLDVALSRFFVDRRYEPATGPREGLCLLADGHTLYTWDPFHPDTHTRDTQPANLWDALHVPLGAVLDRDFRGQAHRVSRRDDPGGPRLVFQTGNAAERFVTAFAGDPPTLVAHWTEAPDGSRAGGTTRYRTRPFAAITGRLPDGSQPREPSWFLDRLADAHSRVDAPDLAAQDLAGTPLSWGRFAGRPVLVAFWATWCGKCRPKLDGLGTLAAEFGARVAIVTVSFDQTRALLEAFVASRAMRVPVVWDPDRTVGQAWDVSGVPTVFLLDRRHRVAAAGHAVTQRAVRAALVRLLGETPM